MKRAIILAWCFAVCLMLFTGCISFVGGGSVVQSDKQAKVENTNLFVKVDIEKNGSVVDYTSSIVYKDAITLTHTFNNKLAKECEGTAVFEFVGKNIRKTSEDSYSMDYSIGLKVPVATTTTTSGGNTLNRSVQYMSEGSISSINIKLGQPVYIYENNEFKIKLMIDTKK